MHSKKDEEETERRCSFQASCFWSVLHFRLPVAEAAHCRLRLYYALLLNYVVTTSVDPKELLSWSSNAWKSRRCASAWASASASKLWEYPQSATYPTSLRHLCQRRHRWPAPLLQCCQLSHGLMQVHWRMRRWHVLIYTWQWPLFRTISVSWLSWLCIIVTFGAFVAIHQRFCGEKPTIFTMITVHCK